MGSNEKGMRHDNSKILGFGLLALAAVLALRKTKAPGVGKFSEQQEEPGNENKRGERCL